MTAQPGMDVDFARASGAQLDGFARNAAGSSIPAQPGPAAALAQSGPSRDRPETKVKRASAACTRCRRYRQKCEMKWENGKASPPCHGCVKIGLNAASACTIVPRGLSASDRKFRRRPARPHSQDEPVPDYLHQHMPMPSLSSARGLESAQPRTNTRGPVQPPPRTATLSSDISDYRDRASSTTSQGIPTDVLLSSLASYSVDGSQASNPALSPSSSLLPLHNQHRSLLPPHSDIIEGCRVFLFSYFQLGFLPRAFFLEQVTEDPSAVPTFLLLAILTLAARFTPCLIRRFGGRKEASLEMRRRALSMLADEMMEATVERMQALFLLGVSEFGEGSGGRSWLLTGIAIRMAATLQLHREATYVLSKDASEEERVRSESMRRSFWLVYCHDQQTAGRSPGTTFPMQSVDVLLPTDEDDFIFGHEPISRSALPGTLAARADFTHYPEPNRSLFASMIIGQSLWARTAELSCRVVDLATSRPWQSDGDFALLDHELQTWEMNLPSRHAFSPFTLKVMKSQHLDLGFVSTAMLLRLSHIVLRRAYLPWMISSLDVPLSEPAATSAAAGCPQDLWSHMALHMVQNCIVLHDLIQASLKTRSAMDGFPAVFIFCVYMCGDVAYYLHRWPALCPKHAVSASSVLHSSLEILEQLEEAWPLATRWKITLQQLVTHSSRMDKDIPIAGMPDAVGGSRTESPKHHASYHRPMRSNDRSVPFHSPTSDMRSNWSDPSDPFTTSRPDDGQAVRSTTAMMPPPTPSTAGQTNQNPSAAVLDPLVTLYQAPAPDSMTGGAVNQPFAGGDPMDPNDPRHLEIQQWTDALNTDCFGADLTAFLRGETVDWSVDPATNTPSGIMD